MNNPRTFRIALVALMVALTASGCGLLPKEEEEPAPKLAAPVKAEKVVYEVKRGDILEEIVLRAHVVPARSEALAYKNGGRVRTVHVASGDRVAKGQLLAELYADDAEHQAARARILYQKAALSLEEARSNSETPAIRLKQLELDLELARLERDRLEGVLAQSRLVAPFSGVITGVAIKAGDTVQPYATAVSLADPGNLVIEAETDSVSLLKLAVGQKARLEFSDALPAGSTATLVELTQSDGKTSPRARLKLDTPADKLQMGMLGRARIVLQEKQAVLLLPRAAVREFMDRRYVLTREPRREVDVQLGIESETEVEIVKGLAEGEQVIGR